ncbi:solute symporter family protein [Acidocella facilis]|uniref:solute symporter family protein n=1 Tax=Acidocella facilis TaxID=525 RepID=UPI001EEA2823|nr:sodium/solute symporter [Acidocella facilis]
MNTASIDLGKQNATAIFFFLLFIAFTLGVVWWAARRTKTTDDYFTAGGNIGAVQNGLALAGDFVAAAGFLGISGLVALSGFGGIIYYIGGLIGWPIMLFLFGGPMRNLGKYTLGDVLAERFNKPSIRITTSISTLIIVLCYLIGQMVGAGTLVRLLFGLPYEGAVICIGIVMLIYVMFGGMIATTWVQIIKTVLMLTGVLGIIVLALGRFHFNPAALFSAASNQYGSQVLSPGRFISNPIEAISLSLALALGVSSLPHVLMRFFTVPDARAASRSLVYATCIIAIFVFATFILGFAAMVLVGRSTIVAADQGGNMAVPLLAEQLGGTAFFGFISAISFATILAVVAGLMITGATTLASDLWSNVVRRGHVSSKEQFIVARGSIVLLTVAAITLGIFMRGQNVGFLVGLSLAIAASANFPVIVLAIYWRQFNHHGAIAGIITGLLSSLLLIYLSPTVQIDLLHRATAVIALRNPGIIAIPLAFFVSIVISLATGGASVVENFIEYERRMLLGSSDA